MKKYPSLITALMFLTVGISVAQTCEMFVGGYVPSYRDPSIVDYSKLSHTFYAFAKTDDDGALIVDNVSTTFVTFKSASTSTRRYLSLAGGGGHESYSSMTESAAAIQAFAENCVAFCQTHSLQGIDVDWEGIITNEDSVKYGALIRALASSLHSNDLELVVTVAYGSYGGDHYNIGAMKHADWIQLMVYDQTGTWSESPYGNHSTFQHVEDAVTYWKNRGYTYLDKMVIGVPFYGYTFNSTAGGLATGVTYSEITTDHPHLHCDQDEIGLTVFNGPETIRQKVEYVKTNGLKGVMIWEMAQDLPSSHSKSLLKAISLSACGLPPACEDVVLGLPETIAASSVQLRANPVLEAVEISLNDLPEKIASLELTDALGKTFFSKVDSFSATESISLSNKSAGLYFLRIKLRDQTTVVKRFIKL